MPKVEPYSWRPYRLVWSVLALGALLLGLGIYLTTRIAPPPLLHVEALRYAVSLPPGFAWLSVNMPSFLHVFAFSLLTASCLPAGKAMWLAVPAAWAVVNLGFEMIQSDTIAAALPMVAGVAKGVFDAGDVAAILLGAICACWVLSRPELSVGHNDRRAS